MEVVDERGVDDDDYVVGGPVLRIMWDEGAGPLWSTGEGLLPDDPDWLKRALGLSDTLIADLLGWLREKDTAHRFHQSPPQLDDRAERLVGRLQAEVGSRFTVRYHR
jgi:hypothetical protein